MRLISDNLEFVMLNLCFFFVGVCLNINCNSSGKDMSLFLVGSTYSSATLFQLFECKDDPKSQK